MITRRSLSLLAVALLAPLALAGCGATDQISDAKKIADAGIETGNYLQSVQPELTGFGAAVSSVRPDPEPLPASAKRYEDAADKLEVIGGKLEKVKPEGDFKKGHAELIDAVDQAEVSLRDMATAATEKDKAAYTKSIEAFTDASGAFSTAMQTVTEKATKAAQEVSQG
jgi:hypothetical protein